MGPSARAWLGALCGLAALAGSAAAAVPEIAPSPTAPLELPPVDGPDAAKGAEFVDSSRRLARLAERPSCAPSSYLCALGRLSALENAVFVQAVTGAFPGCKPKTRGPADPCWRKVGKEYRRLKDAQSAITEAATLKWPAPQRGQPLPKAQLDLFIAGLGRELAAGDCPMTDELCGIGRIQALGFLADPDLGPFLRKEEDACAYWERKAEEVRPVVRSGFLALLRGGGWPSDDWGVQVGISTGRVARAFEADPEVTTAMVDAIKLARAAGRTDESYAEIVDKQAVRVARPQPYGTQGRCMGERWQPHPIAEPDRLDALRAEAGETSFAESRASHDESCRRFEQITAKAKARSAEKDKAKPEQR